MELQNFINIARFIAYEKGLETRNSALVVSGTSTNAREFMLYENSKLLIRASMTTLALEVVLLENMNPVVVVLDEGIILRSHGERRLLTDEVRSLLNSINVGYRYTILKEGA